MLLLTGTSITLGPLSEAVATEAARRPNHPRTTAIGAVLGITHVARDEPVATTSRALRCRRALVAAALASVYRDHGRLPSIIIAISAAVIWEPSVS
jgi:hypothetical protein